ncbi:phosphoribulokinase, chloroplastic [Tanacetum coccineum]|uniref:Phosphoribulokinase n=1 Tax=Tanacetum coccineum TaxID=301880 RepID=A0ABQ5C037_9ASTR
MAVSTVYTVQSLNSTCSISTPTKTNLGIQQRQVLFFNAGKKTTRGRVRGGVIRCAGGTIVIGLAADSGCGKSTFMRRLTSVFGGAAEPPKGGNPDSNTLISDTTTVICLDDYHSLDRTGRKVEGVTALDPRANNFDLMYEQVKALKDGIAVEKPIYNHVSGLLDPPELIKPPKILVIEGLHPMYDQRVRDLLDFSIYLDISNDVKFAWKIQRDMAERGHSLESIKASIEARKPDFDAYIGKHYDLKLLIMLSMFLTPVNIALNPQKQYADAVIEVLPTQLIPDDNEGKVLRVKLIMKEGVKYFSPVYLFDEGSTISWIPCGRKLTCSYPGIKFAYGPDSYYDHEVSVLEMDGQFDRLDELIYVESHLSNISTKFYGEITQQMLKHADFPGSNNGTGLFQTIVGLKIRDLFEQITASKASAPLEATKA